MKSKLLISALLCLGLFSCLEDKTPDFEMLSPIRIETTGLPLGTYSLFQFDTLRIAPTIYREGSNDEKLGFEWKIQGENIDRVLGHSMTLNAEIIEPERGKEYNIMLTVTDSTTMVQAYQTWYLKVSSIFQEGLIIADTRDEQVTDLSLIIALNFTSAFKNDKQDTIFRNIYSKVNGAPIQGVANSLTMNHYGGKARTLTVLTPTSITRANPASYDFMDNGRFVINIQDKILPRDIKFEGRGSDEIMNINGHLYARSLQNNNYTFNLYMLPSDMADYNITAYNSIYYSYANYFYSKYVAFAYDEIGKRFFILPTFCKSLLSFQPSSNKYFNPNDLGDKTCIYMGNGTNHVMHALMKDPAGNYMIYSIKGDVEDDGSDAIKAGAYRLTNCTNIQQARFWSFSRLENLMYYATEKAIYATSTLNTDEISATDPCYTLEGEDKITSMEVWGEGGKCYLPTTDPDAEEEKQTINSQSRMIVITTYNERTKEGKVITIPIERTGVGELIKDRSYHTEYKGFGRIVAIGSQKA